MRATKHQAVDLLRQHRPQVFLRSQARDLVVQPALFHQRHEQRAGLRVHPRRRIERMDATRVGIAVDRGGRADHADASARRLGHGSARAGLDDVQHRNVPRQPVHHMRRHRRHGVAGNDQHLHVALQQEAGDLLGELLDRGNRLHAVGHARGIAKIDDVLERQALHQRPHDGQPADAGVEHADRARGIGRRQHAAPLPAPVRGADSLIPAPLPRTCACRPAARPWHRPPAPGPCHPPARRSASPRPVRSCASPPTWNR